MPKLLIFILAAAVYLTPLYPVYAQPVGTAPRALKPASNSGALRPVGIGNAVSDQLMAKKEKMATRAAELKSKLQKFKDKTKASRVENINENLNTVNTKSTSEMQQNLSRISEIVTKLKAWAATEAAAGKNISAINTAITDIESKWTAAKSAVDDQADNDYTVVVNSETTVKADAQAARNTLHTDLKTVHDKIILVRQSLMSAFSSWKGVK